MDRSRTGVEESRYDLRLVSAADEPERVARTITEFTDRTRREAMGMIETAPVLILQGTNYATAAGARTAMERLAPRSRCEPMGSRRPATAVLYVCLDVGGHRIDDRGLGGPHHPPQLHHSGRRCLFDRRQR
jgi:hypothetical protein